MLRPIGLLKSPRATCLPPRSTVSVSVASSKARLQRRQALVAHQHQEVDLRQVRRLLGIEAPGAVLHRVGAVEWAVCPARRGMRSIPSGDMPLTG